jgi:hypothetical protein
MNLAILFSTCDKYSYLWEGWKYYFDKNFRPDLPVYSVTETKDIGWSDRHFKVNKKLWTPRINQVVKQIDEENILLLLDDLFIIKEMGDQEFRNIYDKFIELDAHALRILSYKSRNATENPTKHHANGVTLYKLTQRSKYLICYMPNIWKKSFLDEVTKYNEDIWNSEYGGNKRLYGRHWDIYSYVKPDWIWNVVKTGIGITPKGKELINAASKHNTDSRKG